MTRSRSSGVIVFRRLNNRKQTDRLEVLLVRYGQHHWGFPKGRMEDGETEEVAAIREVREETGIAVAIEPGFRKMTSYVSRSGRLQENVFFVGEPLVKEALPVAQLSEISAAGWKDAYDVEDLVTFPGDYPLYLEAREYWTKRHLHL